MAWNGSGGGAANSTQRMPRESDTKNAKARERGRRWNAAHTMRGLLALAIVVVGGGLAWWCISGRQAPVPEVPVVPDVPSRIKEHTPAAVATSATLPKPAPKPDPNARPTKVGEVVNGYVLLPSGRLHRRTGVITNSAASRPQAAYRIFKTDTDNEIACYLSVKPGEGPFGPRRYTGRFKEQFLESLKTPIEITDDDTPEQAQLKRDVLAAREELKAALDRGEDIEQIMLDTREELQDLTHYRAEVQGLFNEARLNTCETEQDVEDLFDACNKLLAEKGIAPIKFGPITRRRLLSERLK